VTGQLVDAAPAHQEVDAVVTDQHIGLLGTVKVLDLGQGVRSVPGGNARLQVCLDAVR
jgi:hypothetical protein